MEPASTLEAIQATLAPAFLISAVSIFLNFTQTRLFRVLDRTRTEAAQGMAEARRAHLLRRARLLRNAIALGVLAVAFTVLTAVLLMAGLLFGLGGTVAAAPTAFGLGMAALLFALVAVLWDTVLSVRSVVQMT